MIESFKLPTIIPETVSGSICSLSDEYGNLPLKSCVSQIQGWQEGSGIPSPQNEMPLHAFSSASLGKCDNNTASLWSIDNSFNGDVEFNQWIGLYNYHLPSDSALYNTNTYTVNGVIFTKNSDGSISIQTTAEGATDRASVKIGTPLTIPILNTGSNHIFYLSLFGEDVSQTDCYLEWGSRRRVTPQIKKDNESSGFNMWIVVNSGTILTTPIKAIPQIIDLTVMFGSTIADYIYNLEQAEAGAGVAFFKSLYPDDYYAYNTGTKQLVGDTLATFNFGQDIYSGYIDWKRGVVVATHKTVDLGSLTYSYSSAYLYFYTTSISDRKYGNTILCLADIYEDLGDKSASAMADIPDYKMASNNNSVQIKFKNTNYTTPNDFKTAMSGKYLAYELATPIEIPLGGVNLLTQEGQNNIFVDCGNSTVEWLKVN